jgi:hypothetical protein
MNPARFPAFGTVPAAAGAVALAVLITACGSTAGGGTPTVTRMAGTGHTTAAPVSAKATAPAPAASIGSATTGSAAAGTSPATSSAASPAGTASLTGAAATALITKAFANTEASASVRVTGESVSTGSGSQAVSFDLTLVRDKGCQGTIALSKTETFQMVQTGGYVWILPSTAFYASMRLSKAALALIADKYIKVKSSNSEFGDLVKICSFSGLFGSLPKVTGTGYVATPTTYNGRPAYHLTEASKAGEAIISNTSTPLILKLSQAGADGGAITFTDYDAARTVTAPSAAESVDGSQLGL